MTKRLNSVCVYCGSASGIDPVYVAAAKALARDLAARDIRLVYGGASIGLMGALASDMKAHGGTVIGIMPDFLREREVQADYLDNLILTTTMHARKQQMYDHADAFVALPGGMGTLDETVEMLTWAQLGRHEMPIVLANINDFWDPLIELFDHMIATGFVKSGARRFYSMVDRVEDIVPRLEASL